MHIIRKCQHGEVLHIVTNDRSHKYYMIGMFKVINIYAHYKPESLSTILSLKGVSFITGARVTMDTGKERVIVMHLINGNTINFKECSEGLYFLILKLVPLKLITFLLPNTLHHIIAC